MKKNAITSTIILTVFFLAWGMIGYSAQCQKESDNREAISETSSEIVTYPVPPRLETSPVISRLKLMIKKSGLSGCYR